LCIDLLLSVFLVGIATELAWILSTMKVAATAAQAVPPRLAFFQSDVLGLARSCDKIAATSAVAEQNMYHSRVVDLWSLFPCFCKSPLDIEAAMPALTATLGRALEDKRYPELLVRCGGD
jgi:ribosomal RNA-processing protein 12